MANAILNQQASGGKPKIEVLGLLIGNQPVYSDGKYFTTEQTSLDGNTAYALKCLQNVRAKVVSMTYYYQWKQSCVVNSELKGNTISNPNTTMPNFYDEIDFEAGKYTGTSTGYSLQNSITLIFIEN